MDAVVKKVLKEDKEEKVQFIILYGSQTQGTATPLSDTDVAIFYDGDKKERFNFRVRVSGVLGDKFDVQIFQDLPLYIRKEVLKGEVLYQKDVDFLYETAIDTVKEYGLFKRYLDAYYEEVEKNGIVATIT